MKQIRVEDIYSYDYLVVGSGFFGSTISILLASFDKKACVIDKNPFVGGLSSSDKHESGIHYHRFGSHIFHTDDKFIWDFVNRFATFNDYRHKVLAEHKEALYQVPVTLETINKLFQQRMSPSEAKLFFQKEALDRFRNLEECGIHIFGERIFDAFFREYTEKQWKRPCNKLPADIIQRIAIRYNYDSDYFKDKYQGIPNEEYNHLFCKMLTHKNIGVLLNTNYKDLNVDESKFKKIIYTGRIDEYFNYELGNLEYRSLEFSLEEIDTEDYQGTAVINYPEKRYKYTRVHEPKHFHPDKKYKRTIIIKEYPKISPKNPYYPINSPVNMSLYAKYKEMALKKKNVLFGGRLGEFKYYDMDDTIKSAFNMFKREFYHLEDSKTTEGR